MSEQSAINEFMKGLPSYDERNFTLYNTERGIRNCSQRLTKYLSTKDILREQIIINDDANISLRYLHQQWKKKNNISPKIHDQTHIEQNGDSN